MKNRLLFIGAPLIIVTVFSAFLAWSDYHSPLDTTGVQYISPEAFRNWFTQGKALVVDVQTYADYTQMHFPGSLPTHAYPVRTPSQKKRIEAIIPTIKKSGKPVVLVCPGGITGAPNARLHLISRGIPNRMLYILEGGTWGYPWKGMMVKGNSL